LIHGLIIFEAFSLALDRHDVEFEPIDKIFPILVYLFDTLDKIVNIEIIMGPARGRASGLMLTFATSRTFFMNRHATFIGFSKSVASEIMLPNSRNIIAASRARCHPEGLAMVGSGAGVGFLEDVSTAVSSVRCNVEATSTLFSTRIFANLTLAPTASCTCSPLGGTGTFSNDPRWL
jgi:hypothetical protein